ncbi:MAG: hypothetical protein ACREI3_11325 [Nitrospirales bacterium]
MRQTAVIAGVGPGLGTALVRKVVKEGCRRGAVDFSSAKFAVRGLADSLARELWPKGIHVGHVVLAGVIDTPEVRRVFMTDATGRLLDPTAVAEACWALVTQVKSAWTLELDVRPFQEDFYV